ncbi:MAG: TetR/AcrR family transcriptional regulator [Chloroflexi bacterium]|nr:TetR/AcrR family transcriptional regulator [Chloroflexota bacterium]
MNGNNGEQRYPNKLTEILKIAAELFHDHGYDKTTMRDIANATSLTTAGLYHHIGSKEHLLYLINMHAFEEVEGYIFGPVQQLADPHEKLRMLIVRTVRLILSRKAVVVLLREKAGIEGAYGEIVREKRRRYLNLTESVLLELREKTGATDSIDPKVAAFSLISIANWLPMWYNPRGRLTEAQVVESIFRLLTNGFLGNCTVYAKREMTNGK